MMMTTKVRSGSLKRIALLSLLCCACLSLILVQEELFTSSWPQDSGNEEDGDDINNASDNNNNRGDNGGAAIAAASAGRNSSSKRTRKLTTTSSAKISSNSNPNVARTTNRGETSQEHAASGRSSDDDQLGFLENEQGLTEGQVRRRTRAEAEEATARRGRGNRKGKLFRPKAIFSNRLIDRLCAPGSGSACDELEFLHEDSRRLLNLSNVTYPLEPARRFQCDQSPRPNLAGEQDEHSKNYQTGDDGESWTLLIVVNSKWSNFDRRARLRASWLNEASLREQICARSRQQRQPNEEEDGLSKKDKFGEATAHQVAGAETTLALQSVTTTTTGADATNAEHNRGELNSNGQSRGEAKFKSNPRARGEGIGGIGFGSIKRVEYTFVLGLPPTNSSGKERLETEGGGKGKDKQADLDEVNGKLVSEWNRSRDLLLVNLGESYHTMSLKHLAIFKWILRIQTDDDDKRQRRQIRRRHHNLKKVESSSLLDDTGTGKRGKRAQFVDDEDRTLVLKCDDDAQVNLNQIIEQFYAAFSAPTAAATGTDGGDISVGSSSGVGSLSHYSKKSVALAGNGLGVALQVGYPEELLAHKGIADVDGYTGVSKARGAAAPAAHHYNYYAAESENQRQQRGQERGEERKYLESEQEEREEPRRSKGQLGKENGSGDIGGAKFMAKRLEETQSSWIMCARFPENSLVLRQPERKWCLSRKEYEFDAFPAYCSGLAYLSSRSLLRRLFLVAHALLWKPDERYYKNPLWIDDVFVTGLLMASLADKPKVFALNSRFCYTRAQQSRATAAASRHRALALPLSSLVDSPLGAPQLPCMVSELFSPRLAK